MRVLAKGTQLLSRAMFVVGLCLVAGGLVYDLQAWRRAMRNGASAQAENIFVEAGALLTMAGAIIATFARRLARAAEVQAYPALRPEDDLGALLGDPRPPVVYLRSFGDDRTAARSGAWLGVPYALAVYTEEEQLAQVLSEVGPCVALGRPGERLPRLGITRVVVPHAEWQATVERWMTSARFVVVRTGTTPGLRWEIDTAARLLPPEQLILLVPRSRRARAEARRIMAALSRSDPPPIPGTWSWHQSVCAMITFGHDWTPRVERLRRGFTTNIRMPYVPMFRRAFQAAGLAGG